MNTLLHRCREMFGTGAPVDDVLGLMRYEGQSRTASIAMLIELTGMTLREAKTAVHLSPAWADVREETDTFHAQMERAVDQLRKPDTPIE